MAHPALFPRIQESFLNTGLNHQVVMYADNFSGFPVRIGRAINGLQFNALLLEPVLYPAKAIVDLMVCSLV